MASSTSGAKQRLMTELQALQKEKWVNIEVGAGLRTAAEP